MIDLAAVPTALDESEGREKKLTMQLVPHTSQGCMHARCREAVRGTLVAAVIACRVRSWFAANAVAMLMRTAPPWTRTESTTCTAAAPL